MSTRCTDAPQSWQGGEARAIRSALFIASPCLARSTRPQHRSGTGQSRSLRTARIARLRTEGPVRGRGAIGGVSRGDRQPWPRRCLCVGSPFGLSLIQPVSGGSPAVSGRSELGAMDRCPGSHGPSAHAWPTDHRSLRQTRDAGCPVLQPPRDRALASAARNRRGGLPGCCSSHAEERRAPTITPRRTRPPRRVVERVLRQAEACAPVRWDVAGNDARPPSGPVQHPEITRVTASQTNAAMPQLTGGSTR
jgi:hypothetical protein